MTVTALLPVKDYHPAHLHAALGSMFAQTSPDWRLLIVAEADRAAAARRELAPHLDDPRVELIANEGRLLSGAFNTGMRHAQTDFVAILLGDDMWSPDAAAVLERNIRERPEVDFFHSALRTLAPDGGRHVRPSPTTLGPDDFVRGAVKHLLCWRRSKALSFGGMDESLNSVGPDDFDFPWSMADHGARFGAIPECLYLYRDHRDSFRLTTHLPRSVHAAELRRIMRKHGTGRVATELHVLVARRTYLRQCLYRSPLDRRLRQRLGLGPRPAWYEELP
jgi:glycosyltransferase involved in cell wall biosynthesis